MTDFFSSLLIGNTFGLLLAGLLLEPAMGSIRLTICYFFCGIAGSSASVIWHKATVSVGASGAIFGLWGILLGLSFFKNGKIRVGGTGIIATALIFLGSNLFVGLTSGGIDNATHLGGLGCGILIGIGGGAFPELLPKKKDQATFPR